MVRLREIQKYLKENNIFTDFIEIKNNELIINLLFRSIKISEVIDDNGNIFNNKLIFKIKCGRNKFYSIYDYLDININIKDILISINNGVNLEIESDMTLYYDIQTIYSLLNLKTNSIKNYSLDDDQYLFN